MGRFKTDKFWHDGQQERDTGSSHYSIMVTNIDTDEVVESGTARTNDVADALAMKLMYTARRKLAEREFVCDRCPARTGCGGTAAACVHSLTAIDQEERGTA